ncbi:N-acyl-D-glucosamine 2-epimerase [Bacillus sp. FJAT-28004]|uniref:N-acyl-D-glucosamine 2-epimerase n=1 Tax=Bacillus sp. FJAT-28004 TaxID=1679165 RepID=UPI000ADBF8C2|nr:N-acyl-D-glucosamine 2-epimerase [Bacillus sp. FJAT-28004]
MSTLFKDSFRNKAIFGPSIQIDPSFPYYQQRSPESIVEEIMLAGYQSVHYFVVNEHVIQKDLLQAFRQKGIPVWAMVIGNGTFSTERFPEEWPSWQMKLLKEPSDGFWRLSPFSEGYVQWKKSAMAKLVTDYPFDGIEIAEPYFPEWGGIQRGIYGDVGPLAESAFRSRYGMDMPEFTNTAAPNYYLRDLQTYNKWIDFRVEAVNGFINEMINGKGGVREVRPDIAVATWSLAIHAGQDSLERLREDQGLHAPSMIESAQPDIHFLQTHWPDWLRGDLSADYVKNYQPFVEQIRERFPDLPLAVQADIGSAQHMIKGGEWLKTFSQTAFSLGYASWTAYEYHTGGYIYEEKPFPMLAERISSSEIVISFNKRIDEYSAMNDSCYKIWNNGASMLMAWDLIAVDGNRVMLRSEQLPEAPFVLELSDIRDTPERWLFKDKPANVIPYGTRMSIPGAY